MELTGRNNENGHRHDLVRVGVSVGQLGLAESAQINPVDIQFSARGELGITAADLRRLADIAEGDEVVWLSSQNDQEDLVERLDTLSFVGGAVSIIRSSQQLFVDGRERHIKRKEFEVLELLGINAGRVVTRDFMTHRLWDGYTGGRNIDVNIYQIRAALENYRWIIKTRLGVGYLLDDKYPPDESP